MLSLITSNNQSVYIVSCLNFTVMYTYTLNTTANYLYHTVLPIRIKNQKEHAIFIPIYSTGWDIYFDNDFYPGNQTYTIKEAFVDSYWLSTLYPNYQISINFYYYFTNFYPFYEKQKIILRVMTVSTIPVTEGGIMFIKTTISNKTSSSFSSLLQSNNFIFPYWLFRDTQLNTNKVFHLRTGQLYEINMLNGLSLYQYQRMVRFIGNDYLVNDSQFYAFTYNQSQNKYDFGSNFMAMPHLNLIPIPSG